MDNCGNGQIVRPAGSGVVCSFWSILLLAIALTGGSFLLQGYSGFNLADEGFLWYGVEQTAHGQVPLRDFQSYDPGRYYWGAAWALAFGKGLISLRCSESAFQVLGLCAGLMAMRRLVRGRWPMLMVAVAVTVWMFPTHKLFDHSLLLAGLLAATYMLELPSAKRVFIAGLFVGVCTFFGRNHALYNGAAQFSLLLFLGLKLKAEFPFSRFLIWCFGIAVGVLPLLLMLACVPGFLLSYQQSFEAIFRNGPNLALPIPWPWTLSPDRSWVGIERKLVLGSFMLALPIGYIAALAAALRFPANLLRQNSLLVGSAAVGLFYLHHIYSRADVSHLAQGIHPFIFVLIGFAFLVRKRQACIQGAAILIIVSGLLEIVPLTPIYQRITSPVKWVACNALSGVFVLPDWARSLDALRRFGAQNIPRPKGVFIAPFSPGLYPVLDRVSPVWETYLLFPLTAARQKEVIQTLERENVAWVILSNETIDQRNDLRFSSTCPLIWQEVQKNFRALPDPQLPAGLTVYRRRGVSPEVPAPATSLPSTP